MSTPPAHTRIRWSPIVLLETTNLVSGMSNGVVTIAIPWLVLQRTGSVTAAGLVAALSALPGIIASPLAGWAVDHFGRRIVSIFSDILSAISVAAIPLVAMVTDLNLAIILALAMLGAVFDPAGYTARRALIPDVAEASGMEVTRLNGLHEGIFGIGWIVGPLAGSLLIAALGDTAAFWVPFALFVLAAILIGFLRVSDAGQVAKAEREEAGIAPLTAWQNASLGAKLIWRDHTLRAITIAVMVITPQRLLKITLRRFMTGIGRQRGRFGQSDPMFASNTPLAPPIVHVLETGPKFWRFAATKRQSGTTSASGMTDAPPYRIVAILLIFAMPHSKGHWQTRCAAAIHHPWTRRSRRQISADPSFPTRQV